METLSLRLPDSLYEKIKEIAKRDGVSFNDFIVSAVAEKVDELTANEYLSERAAKGNKDSFLAVMNKVDDSDPDDKDRL